MRRRDDAVRTGIQLEIFTDDPVRQMLLTEVDMDISVGS